MGQIYTFQETNGIRKFLLYAEDKEAAFKEVRKRFGTYNRYVLVAYTDVQNFSRFI